jgi:membrane protein
VKQGREHIKCVVAFIVYVAQRFSQNRSSSVAAELTITSLLALVPLTTVIFALVALVPNFNVVSEQLQNLMFKYLVPGTGEVVKSYINEFVGKARGLSGLGSLMLLITALLMMRTIDSSFNKIWHTQSRQSVVKIFLVYWSVLTLGPLLLGSSLLVSSYLQTLPLLNDVSLHFDLGITNWLPFIMECLAFTVMLYVIPNTAIRFKHALIAGAITAILFELAKSAFAVFVSSFSTYQVIFGALASIPLFLIWIYLCWLIILIGAEFCHALANFKQTFDVKQPALVQLVLLISLLTEHQNKGVLLEHDNSLLNQLEMSFMQSLIEKGLVSRTQENQYCLVGSLEQIDYLTLFNLAQRQMPTVAEVKQSRLSVSSQKQLIKFIQQTEAQLSDHLAV